MNKKSFIYPRITVGAQLETDLLEEISKDLFSVISIGVRMFTDFSPAQLLALGSILGKYEDPRETFTAALAQLKDLEKDELPDVLEAVKEGFDLENDDLERKIETLLSVLVNGGSEILETLDLVAGIVATVKDKDKGVLTKIKELATKIDDVIDQGSDFLDAYNDFRSAWSDIFDKVDPEVVDKKVSELS
jgi:hypothetical protein